MDCKNKKDTEEMDVILLKTSQLVLYLDGHLEKRARHDRLKAPQLLKLFAVQNKHINKLKKLNKKKVSTLLTGKLEEHSKKLCQSFDRIVENKIVACPTRQDIKKLRGELDQCFMTSVSHSVKQIHT